MTKNLRHAGSFFLKIGAAIFCFGHIIHMTLNGVKHIYSMQVASKENLLTWSLLQSSDEHVEEMCGQVLSLVYDFVHATFSLLQLYFIFKYGNVIVNKRRWLARITFAHCISSCISFWVYTLYSGTLDEIVKKYFPKNIYKEECYYDSSQNVNASINATYMWTSCVKEDFTSIGNNIRCVVNTSKEFVHFFIRPKSDHYHTLSLRWPSSCWILL